MNRSMLFTRNMQWDSKCWRFKTPWGRFLIRIYNVIWLELKNADFTRFWRSPALAHLKSWSWRWRAPRMAVAQKDGSLPFFWRFAKTASFLYIYLEDCQRPLKLTDVLQILLILRYLHWCFWGSWWHRRGVLANSRGVSCHRIQEMGFPKNLLQVLVLKFNLKSFSGHPFIGPWPRTPELPFDPGRNWCEVTDMAGFDRTWALKFWAWNHCASESLEILLKWWNWPVMEFFLLKSELHVIELGPLDSELRNTVQKMRFLLVLLCWGIESIIAGCWNSKMRTVGERAKPMDDTWICPVLIEALSNHPHIKSRQSSFSGKHSVGIAGIKIWLPSWFLFHQASFDFVMIWVLRLHPIFF